MDAAQQHAATAHLMRYFDSEHLPDHLARISRECQALATAMHDLLPACAETTAGMRKLLEAKDCFVRSRIDA